MIHLRYEFKNRAAMLKELSKHFAKGVFIDGDIVDLGFKHFYNEITKVSTIISGYRVDILWKIKPPKYTQEVTPKNPDHKFSGI
tara:strand:- start:110 stop:361 length:252 start_codon:yes stop_codon:yes gene_type:complete